MKPLSEVIADVIARLNGNKQTITDLTNANAVLKDQLATSETDKANLPQELADAKAQLDAYHAETDQLIAALAQFQDAPPAADTPPAEAPPAADTPPAQQ